MVVIARDRSLHAGTGAGRGALLVAIVAAVVAAGATLLLGGVRARRARRTVDPLTAFDVALAERNDRYAG